MSEMPAQATLPPQRMEAAMWREGIVDWIVLGSGYLLALGLFAWLGGFACAATGSNAGEACRRAKTQHTGSEH